jgi:hypothetical protein
MKTFLICALGAASLLTLGGCATSRGSQQDNTPPRLVERNKTIAWDRGDAFGPVPLQLASLAAVHCATLNTKDTKWEAEGFHARAQNLQGKAFPAGGYFCKGRARSQ